MDVDRLTEEVEAVSQIYALRYEIERDATWFLLKLQEEVGELLTSVALVAGLSAKHQEGLRQLNRLFGLSSRTCSVRSCCWPVTTTST